MTSSAASRLDACLEVTELAAMFAPERRFSAENSLPQPTSKPDPAIYTFADRQLDITPDQGIAIEDSINGAMSAVAAGYGAPPSNTPRARCCSPSSPPRRKPWTPMDACFRAGAHLAGAGALRRRGLAAARTSAPRNRVRVTSLFYLVPPATALETYVLLSAELRALAVAGIVVAMTGVALVLRNPARRAVKG